MLEGTDAKVHFIRYTPEMEQLRADGELRTNSFLRIRRLPGDGEPVLDVQDLGDSEKALQNRTLLGENAMAMLKRGIVPTEDGWGGWLGRYQAALAKTGHEIIQNREIQSERRRDSRRDKSRGR
jgi:hypothetical protein